MIHRSGNDLVGRSFRGHISIDAGLNLSDHGINPVAEAFGDAIVFGQYFACLREEPGDDAAFFQQLIDVGFTGKGNTSFR